MSKLIFKTLLILLTTAGIFGLERFCNRQTDGFALHKVFSDLAYDPEWEIEPLKPLEHEQVQKILSQKFSYLGKGVQCYAFLSEDQNYVLKFFRYDHMRVPLWLKVLPLPSSFETYRKTKEEFFQSRRLKDFRSYKMAYEYLQKETGLIYLHLNKSSDLQKKVTIFDKIGIRHQIDLDQMEFVLQRRASHVYPQIKALMQRGEVDTAKKAIVSLVHLITKRSQLGIYDKDPDIVTNFGIIEDKMIQIDIGRYRMDETRKENRVIHDDVIRITDKFKKWLDGNYPELGKVLEQEIEKI